MREDLHGRSLVKDSDLNAAELHELISLALSLKRERRSGGERQRLAGKNVALLFEKPSTRTRAAFEVASHEQGAHTTYLDTDNSHLTRREPVRDTARFLGRLYDGIQIRSVEQSTVELLAKYAGVPVWNGMSDRWHPTQMICDLMTIVEHSDKPLRDISIAYVGDGRSNVANSLLVGGTTLGMTVRIVSPKALAVDTTVLSTAVSRAQVTGGDPAVEDDVDKGVHGVDFLYSDTWVWINEPAHRWTERARLLAEYRIDSELVQRTDNPNVKVMHCLPAIHGDDTVAARQFYAETGLTAAEITDEVFESDRSIIFDQAENRMHSIKALLVATLTAVS